MNKGMIIEMVNYGFIQQGFCNSGGSVHFISICT